MLKSRTEYANKMKEEADGFVVEWLRLHGGIDIKETKVPGIVVATDPPPSVRFKQMVTTAFRRFVLEVLSRIERRQDELDERLKKVEGFLDGRKVER